MALWSRLAVAVVSAAIVAGGGYWWWKQRQAAPALTVAQAPVAASAPAPAASEPPAERYPIEDVAGDAPQAPLPSAPTDADRLVADALIGLLGRKDVQGFLLTDGFVRRVVATVDNLGRAQAPASLWPVRPMLGRYSVVQRTDGLWTAETNAMRYEAFTRFVLATDSDKAAALYIKLYPLFQRAYEELGYPGRHFNDRLVHVIDLLLQTPEPAAAPKLKLTQVQVQGQDPVSAARPWLRYEFDDPTLEARPAGQKILLRMGARHERLLKDKLREFRGRIVKAR